MTISTHHFGYNDESKKNLFVIKGKYKGIDGYCSVGDRFTTTLNRARILYRYENAVKLIEHLENNKIINECIIIEVEISLAKITKLLDNL